MSALLSFFLLLAIVQFTVAQDAAVLQKITTDLSNLGLNQMVNLIKSADSSFTSLLTASNQRTFFAPTDDAFGSNKVADPTGLLLYLLIPNGIWTVDKLGTTANHSILTTALTGHHLIFLEGGHPAMIACGNPKANGQIEIYNQNQPTLVTQTQNNDQLNILYHVVNAVPAFPFNYPAWIASLSTTWQAIARSAGQSDDAIGAMLGYTFFVFDADAYSRDLAAHLQSASPTDIFNNHVILGKTIAYNTFTTDTYKTQSGNTIKFTLNPATLEYTVSIGQSSARISRSDILTDNGVIHVIDGTLWDLKPTVTSSPTGTTGSGSTTTGAGSSTTGTTSTTAGGPGSNLSTDVPNVNGDGSTTGGSNTTPGGTGTGSADSQNTGGPQTVDANAKSSLSGGAIGGIVVGVVLAIVLAALAVFCWRRRRQEQVEQWDDRWDDHRHTVQPFTAQAVPVTASSWSAGQPITPYMHHPTSETSYGGRDDMSGSSLTSPTTSSGAPVARREKQPLPSPGANSHSHDNSVSTGLGGQGPIPDQVVDHLLERIAARIDRSAPPDGALPPTYHG